VSLGYVILIIIIILLLLLLLLSPFSLSLLLMYIRITTAYSNLTRFLNILYTHYFAQRKITKKLYCVNTAWVSSLFAKLSTCTTVQSAEPMTCCSCFFAYYVKLDENKIKKIAFYLRWRGDKKSLKVKEVVSWTPTQ